MVAHHCQHPTPKPRPPRDANADTLNAWINHVEDVLAAACACPCRWCAGCIESVSPLVPPEKIDDAIAGNETRGGSW